MSHLAPCPACERHVRAAESVCPFCGEIVEATAAPPRPTRRLGRAAMFAFGAAVAAATTGCGESHIPGDDASSPDGGTVGSDAGEDAGYDAGNIAPPYGIPPEDAGGPIPLYGGAPED